MKKVMVGLFVCVILSMSINAEAQRNRRLMSTIDTVLLDADFVGVVTVEDMSVRDGYTHVRLVVDDAWITRWDETMFEFTFEDRDGALTNMMPKGANLVVFLSGGPWRWMPFTYRENSIFTVHNDEHISCVDDELYGVGSEGLLCTTSDRVVGAPFDVDGFRNAIQDLRADAERRHPQLAERLSRNRTWEMRPTPLSQTASGVLR